MDQNELDNSGLPLRHICLEINDLQTKHKLVTYLTLYGLSTKYCKKNRAGAASCGWQTGQGELLGQGAHGPPRLSSRGGCSGCQKCALELDIGDQGRKLPCDACISRQLD